MIGRRTSPIILSSILLDSDSYQQGAALMYSICSIPLLCFLLVYSRECVVALDMKYPRFPAMPYLGMAAPMGGRKQRHDLEGGLRMVPGNILR